MTGGSPTSSADPPPIRCSIRSVIRTFWRARARLHAPDADDASGGRRCLAARYGEKRGAFRAPRFSPYAAPSLRSLSPCGPPLSPSSRFRGRSLPPCPVVGACTAAVGGALPQWGRTAAVGGALPQWGRTAAVGAHCRSGGALLQWGRTAAVGAHCRSGGALPQWGAHCRSGGALPQWLSRCLRRVQRRRRRRRARPLNAPCTRGDGGWEGRGSIGPGPRQTPQEARVEDDPTGKSGWRGSVGPGASGAVLGVRAGGQRRRCPATDRRRSA